MDYPLDREQEQMEAAYTHESQSYLDLEIDLQARPSVSPEPLARSPTSNSELSPLRTSPPEEINDPMLDVEMDEPLEVLPGIEQEDVFNNLLGHFPGQHDFYRLPANRTEYIEANDDYDAQFDPDFGLPVQENQHDNVAAQYHFEFNEDLEFTAEDESDTDECHTGNCSAFQEPELIRNAYIDAFVQKHMYGATHRALKHQLKAARRSISAHPNIHIEDISKMAQTITTAEKRLGLDTSSFITVFVLCPVCRRRYSQDDIANADSDVCLNEGCSGVLFTPRKLASGRMQRVPNVTYPFASPIAWIRHILSLPGMSELLQHWRNDDDDNEGLKTVLTSEEWMQKLDLNRSMGDLCDGWGWRSSKAGLERRTDPHTGTVTDESPFEPPVRFVSLPFGLSLTLNTDWFQATKEGNYSVGACYLVINNLPRHMRFLRENISLTILMPGPREPNDYALDQMLSPLIDELLQLKQGIRMNVRQGNPGIFREEVVHGELSLHIADLMARIKMGGGAGLKSELNFCLYCHMHLSSLSVPAGYSRRGFEFRDPKDELRNVYLWRSLQPEERRVLFEQTGNRFTPLHQIPGWYTSTSSPPDAMHLLYLGAMNWIFKQVLVGPGMLTRRHPGGQAPQDLFNECLDHMWMPKNFQRLPPKLGQTQGTIKADQWKLTSKILFVPLFLAFRDGDVIGPGITPAEIHFAQELMELLCVDYVRNNVPLPPNFHYLMHLEEFLLKYGSSYNTHVWGMERANGILSKINHNGRKDGMLESTLMRGWWSHAAIQNLIKKLRGLPNRTEADESIIQDLLAALRGGAEHAQQRGTLMAYIAQCQTAYTHLHGIQEPTRLSGQSRIIDLEKCGIYQLVLDFCIATWPDAGIFGPGMPRQRYLAPTGMVRNYSYVEYDGVRYGASTHTSGAGYCFGYIDGRFPVRIDRVLLIELQGEPHIRCICALVRRFCPPPVEGQFPWDMWASNLGVSSWAYEQLGELTVIPVHRFSGALALFEVPMSYGRYWITVALDNISPERED
ncbi:Transposase family tnp2 [Ceratobasidium sp. AG-Ba]|nr:Transposase family tnp2 [Ceratobasidium sp. AG-Ba]